MTWLIGFAKSFVTGILANALKEAFLAMIGRFKWKFVLERIMTRVAKKSLYWISDRSWNTLSKEDVDVFMGVMDSKGLPAAKRIK